VGLCGCRQNADIADTLHAPKGRCHGNRFLPFDEDIDDFEVLRDVAMATIFGFLYMGCTLAPPEEYD